MTNLKLGLLVAAAPLALFAADAQAQTANVAVIDPSASILAVKAIGPAWQAVNTQYAAAFTTAQTRERTLQATLAPLQKRLDTNNDGQVDEREAAAAQQANKPEVQQIIAAQQAAQNDIANTLQPARIAQAWILDQVKQKYRAALNSVTTRKQIGLVLNAEAAAFATPAADITDDVTAALDAAAPTLTTTPPANWQPDQQTFALYQQFNQALQMAAARAAQQQPQPGAAATTTPPATTQKRDRDGNPIKK